MENSVKRRIKDNWNKAIERVRNAERTAGRVEGAVRVVGVTKYVDVESTRILIDAGCSDVAESRPQSIWEKGEQIECCNVNWHLIGHLQRNKVKRTLRWVSSIHSLDSIRLLDQIFADVQNLSDKESMKTPVTLLLEVNVTADSTKTGLAPSEARALLEHWTKLRPGSRQIHSDTPLENRPSPRELEIVGLMGMSSLGSDPVQIHREFSVLQQLASEWKHEFDLPLDELSMGMSDDFEIAIQHGSTMVRLGSVLFQ